MTEKNPPEQCPKTVSDIIQELQVDENEYFKILVDGKEASLDTPVTMRSEVILIPYLGREEPFLESDDEYAGLPLSEYKAGDWVYPRHIRRISKDTKAVVSMCVALFTFFIIFLILALLIG